MAFTEELLNDPSFRLRWQLALHEQVVVDEDDCWVWTGSIRKGIPYWGSSPLGIANISARRVSYMFAYGWIGKGTRVESTCGYAECINPAHCKVSSDNSNAEDTLRQRFERFFEKSDGCWIWQGPVNKARGGYGEFTMRAEGYNSARAHIVAYHIYCDDPIPDGGVVRHTCDTPACVNPDHLVLGDQKQNMQDMKERGRSAKGEGHSQAKLTAEQVLAIYSDPRKHMDIAEQYGISVPTVSDIKRGHTWTHVTGHSS